MINWPEGFSPQRSNLHVRNVTTSAAPPDAIWAWLVRPDRWRDFYRNAWRVRADAGPWPTLAAGSRFRWVTFGAPVVTTVTECEPPFRLAWTGTGLGSSGHHAWLLEPAAGGTRIVTEETQHGQAVKILAPALRPVMHRAHQAWITGLAGIALTGRPA
jgi:hypothetical protein